MWITEDILEMLGIYEIIKVVDIYVNLTGRPCVNDSRNLQFGTWGMLKGLKYQWLKEYLIQTSVDNY